MTSSATIQQLTPGPPGVGTRPVLVWNRGPPFLAQGIRRIPTSERPPWPHLGLPLAATLPDLSRGRPGLPLAATLPGLTSSPAGHPPDLSATLQTCRATFRHALRSCHVPGHVPDMFLSLLLPLLLINLQETPDSILSLPAICTRMKLVIGGRIRSSTSSTCVQAGWFTWKFFFSGT